MQIMIFPALEAILNKSFFGNINKQISFKSLKQFYTLLQVLEGSTFSKS